MFRMHGHGVSVDENARIAFKFNGARLEACDGDTIASALLANGIRVVGRSFKYHRPRGLVASGAEEPNGLVNVALAGRSIPNVLSTRTRLEAGMDIASQNAWPSMGFDVAYLNNFLYRCLPAGFYYKTFMWPRNAWGFYEKFIRRMAGLGKPPRVAVEEFACKSFESADLLIVGAGPAGLCAALAGAARGERVVLVDQEDMPGGPGVADAPHWNAEEAGCLRELEARVRKQAGISFWGNTTVVGSYDHNFLVLARNIQSFDTRKRSLVKVRARKILYATGAIEQFLAFRNNDVPGVMLAGAMAQYAYRYGVACARRPAFYVNNDLAYRSVFYLHRCGLSIAAVVDERAVPQHLKAELARLGIPLMENSRVAATLGRRAVTGVSVVGGGPGAAQVIACDGLAVSGGWLPLIHLPSQSRLPLRFDRAGQRFLPGAGANSTIACAGWCNGADDFQACLADAERAIAALYGGVPGGPAAAPDAASLAAAGSSEPPGGALLDGARVFVDFQNDVTAKDIADSVQEGYCSIEHLKRYTTLGMGTDQGKLGNMPGLKIFAQKMQKPLDEVGLTTFRPMYVPVPISNIVDHRRSRSRHPARHLAAHDWHRRQGAAFSVSTAWLRPRLYQKPGEPESQAIVREALAVRRGVGAMDVSPLGKIDVRGANALEFVDRVYVNKFGGLPVGKSKYGVMLREDGAVLDDGVVSHLEEHHLLLSASTSISQSVYEQLLFYATVAWPELGVRVANLTEQYGGLALAGPLAREVLAELGTDIPLAEPEFPNMSVRLGRVAGLDCMLTRFSFSGELAYEINVGAAHVPLLLQALAALQGKFPLEFYGTEAMNVLRIEKGHCVTGREIDGRVGPHDLGMDRMLKADRLFVGSQALRLPAYSDPDRRHLVGIVAADPLPSGAHLVAHPGTGAQPSLGVVTSHCYSPHAGKYIGLALLSQGRDRLGHSLYASSPVEGKTARVRVVGKDRLLQEP